MVAVRVRTAAGGVRLRTEKVAVRVRKEAVGVSVRMRIIHDFASFKGQLIGRVLGTVNWGAKR